MLFNVHQAFLFTHWMKNKEPQWSSDPTCYELFDPNSMAEGLGFKSISAQHTKGKLHFFHPEGHLA